MHGDGVIKLLDAFITDDGGYIFVLEQLKSYATLEGITNKNISSLDKSFIRSFFLDPVELVHQCHLEGVIHRDLKEFNILVDETTDKPILIDFVISRLAEDSSFGDSLGTDGYMPP